MFKGGNGKGNTDSVNAPDKLNRIVDGTNIKGDVKADSNFRIDGVLVGSLDTMGKLVIGETGKIEGEIACGNADVEGEINGNIKVEGLLILKSTAIITGNIVAQKIKIENGAAFNGKCTMSGNSSDISNKLIEEVEEANEAELVY